jgi:uncharacterized protein YkwD
MSLGACYLAQRSIPSVPVITPLPQVPSADTNLEQNCLSTFNPVRFQENRGRALQWDSNLANIAILSARHCANVAQVHTNVIGSQILFVTKSSCSDAIKGWFHDEKPVNGGHYQIIKNPNLSKVGCAVVGTGRKCISCNFQ